MVRDLRIEVVSDEMAAILRSKTPGERLRMASDMWKMARRLAECAVRAERPEFSDEQVSREVARRMSHGAV